MTDFVTSDVGVCLISVAIGVGVGLMAEPRSRRSWIGSLLVTAGYVVLLVALTPSTIFAAPLFVVATALTALICDVVRYSQSPLLRGEPGWRKVLLVFVHVRTIRAAADAERSEELQRT
jgi:hypothetical protein